MFDSTTEFTAELEANGIPSGFTEPSQVLRFALAGKAHLTLTSMTSGHHFTYRISQAEDRENCAQKKPVWFVGVLTGGSADSGKFAYLGIIVRKGESFAFLRTAKSKVGPDAPSVKAFTFFWRHCVERQEIPRQLRVQHSGRCGRCGRTLTEPESLRRGVGPECIKLMRCEAV